MFETKEQFLTYLNGQQKFSMKLSLDRIKRACELLGHPELSLKTIHVAGTNGKGSTCNYLANLLKAEGYKVGLYISPYIITFNERIQINGHYISDADLVATANKILPVIEQVEKEMQDDLTEFEVITLLSFVYFQDQAVDYAIFEVGLGGRYDATNVIKPIVGGITNISYDHMGILGDTLEKIGYEKIGIAKDGMTIFTTEERESVKAVFREVKNSVHYDLIELNHSNLVKDINQIDEGIQFYYLPIHHQFTLPMIGNHQVKNALLALEMFSFIMNKEGKEQDVSNMDQALSQSKWLGRLEIVSKNPFVLIDGSHNEDGVLKLAEAMQYYLNKGYQLKIVFAALKDKDTTKMLQMLQSISHHLILTSFDFYRANTGHNLYLQTSGEGVSYNEDFKNALDDAWKHTKEQEILLITGSLYFVAEVKKYLNNFIQ
jgi:dihydrofolate synthase / folylpolyglutamate synthase